jgi:phosphoesterase RecJ-like protein
MTCSEVVSFLQEHDNYLILTHKRPDGDAIGCSVALAEILRGMGKTAWLPAVSDATSLFDEYLEGQQSPVGFVPETVVSVDLATLNLLPDHAQEWRDRIELSIDHHPSNDGYARLTWLEGDKAACGELVFHLAEAVGVMNRTVANALYVAVATDCGCFVYSNTGADTHRVAAALMDAGAEYKRLNKKHFRTKSMARMRLEGLILRDMNLYRDGAVAVAPVSLSMMAEAGAGEGDAEDIAALLGQIDGVRYSATIRELKPGECKISLRSGDAAFNASKACARLGGGGHAAAAGCVVHGAVAEAERAIVDAICAELDS